MKIFILTFFVGIFCLCCSKNKGSFLGLITGGVYVEVLDRKDTIEFLTLDGSTFLNFRTGAKNASGLPMYSTGLYSYTVKPDSIRPVWMASSSTLHQFHYFKMSEDKENFTIGNFYKYDSQASRIRFVRIR